MSLKIYGPKGLLNYLFGKKNVETPEDLYNKAHKLWDEGNTADGYVYLQAAATKGHAEAAFEMANAIFAQKTFGSEKDAANYLTIASEKNHAFATTNLATCYQLGKGVEIDYTKAIRLLNKAISLGDDMAIFNLGQTYFFGVGVQKREKQGWEMISRLADKGNQQASEFIKDLLSKGYVPHELDSDAKPIDPKKVRISAIDHAPECVLSDRNIIELYEAAKNNDEGAKSKLIDLCEDHLDREAMNALRKLGTIKDDTSDNFKYGCAEYIAQAWKSYDVTTLRILVAWTYPGFIYREYYLSDDGSKQLVFQTESDSEFLDKIAKEMSESISKRIRPKYRMREVSSPSRYCVDVAVGSSVSTFYLDIKEGKYLGLYRVFSDTID